MSKNILSTKPLKLRILLRSVIENGKRAKAFIILTQLFSSKNIAQQKYRHNWNKLTFELLHKAKFENCRMNENKNKNTKGTEINYLIDLCHNIHPFAETFYPLNVFILIRFFIVNSGKCQSFLIKMVRNELRKMIKIYVRVALWHVDYFINI